MFRGRGGRRTETAGHPKTRGGLRGGCHGNAGDVAAAAEGKEDTGKVTAARVCVCVCVCARWQIEKCMRGGGESGNPISRVQKK